jgi:hypothetical protein
MITEYLAAGRWGTVMVKCPLAKFGRIAGRALNHLVVAHFVVGKLAGHLQRLRAALATFIGADRPRNGGQRENGQAA